MVVEKIKYDESLRSGTDKLNASIEQSNSAISEAGVAKNTANQAVSTSQEAVTKAESVQAQFNQVVIEGDSSVEAAQARVDAKNVAQPTLKARLDNDYNEVTAQLAETTQDLEQREINVRQSPYNVNADGSDESVKIQQALDDLNVSGGGVLVFPKGTYIAEDLKVYSNIKLRGTHRDFVTIKRPSRLSTDTPKYILYSKDKDLENFTMEGITIDGNYKNLGYVQNGVKPTIQDVMFRNNVPGFKIKNIRVTNCKFINGTNEALGIHGTYVNGDICYDVEDVEVTDCTFKDIYGNAIFIWGIEIVVTNNKMYNIDDTGIGLDLSSNTIVEGNILKYDINHTGYKYLDGVCGIAGAFFAQTDSSVFNNQVEDYLIPIKVDPVTITTSLAARHAVISKNIISSSSRSSNDGLIRILGGSKIIVRDNEIKANDNYGHGISVQPNTNNINPLDIIISDNQIYDTKRSGIYGKTVTDLFIKDNKLTDCGKSGQTFPVDSVYLNGCTDFFVKGNKIKNSGRDSVFVEACSVGFVEGNYTTQSITLLSSTTVFKKRNFINGKPTENEGFSTFSGTGSQTTFSIPHGLGVQPRGGNVTPCTSDAANLYYTSFDTTNINVVFKTAPPSGTNNIKFSWNVFV